MRVSLGDFENAWDSFEQFFGIGWWLLIIIKEGSEKE